jgi:mannose-1-phosphate guanylyltransferase
MKAAILAGGNGTRLWEETRSCRQCLDTWKDKKSLEREWESGHPPWKVWDG